MTARLVCLATLLALATTARAATPRYALVVGSDAGVHPIGGPMPRLRFAERDARLIAESLISRGRFDPERVSVVTGADRAAILAAAETLAEQRRRDRALFGETPALFAFMFTGHGTDGALLTLGDPLSTEDIGAIFETVGADLSVGFFDACHAGSLAVERLRAKGAEPTGFNPIALPQTRLPARGSVWLVSSRSDEVSYEHDTLGGLFSHYFIEAFDAAPADRFGVPLEAMWEYARRRTALHARRLDRAQTPQKVVRRLTSQGPIYFSFPRARTAQLVMGPAVEGRFFLSYRDDTLVESVDKRAGEALEVAIHPGPLVVSVDDGGRRPVWSTEVAEGARLTLDVGAGATGAAPGHVPAAVDRLEGKGVAAALDLAGQSPGDEWWIAAGGRVTPGIDGSAGLYGAELALRRLRGPVGLGIAAGWVQRRDDFEAWSSRIDGGSLRLEGALGLPFGRARLAALAEVEGQWALQRFADGARQDRWTWSLGMGVRGWYGLG
ncbi:MAG: caspase family protein, partial [Myxococcales bacterium]|nr:caspase family protein [Myxococcales bacterium]